MTADHKERIIILGATGSVGQQTLAVIAEQPQRFVVEGLVAHRDVETMVRLVHSAHPGWVAMGDVGAARELEARLSDAATTVWSGAPGILAAIREARPSKVLAAISGYAGLEPALAAIARGFPLLLANKETLVAAGELVLHAAQSAGVSVIPVDSEHSAIFQCLAHPAPFRRIILTCSGGPFRGWSREALKTVTVQETLSHPTWSMGPQITVDSATLMNKGLEMIEAHWLFHAPYERIDMIVHPQSIVHSMVEFVDGATLAQMGWPDMRVPIQVALCWPERQPLAVPPLELGGTALEFESPDLETFPAPRLAQAAGQHGGLYPTVLNAANEEARRGFLEGRIGFLEITEVVADTLEAFPGGRLDGLEAIRETDRWAREVAGRQMSSR